MIYMQQESAGKKKKNWITLLPSLDFSVLMTSLE